MTLAARPSGSDSRAAARCAAQAGSVPAIRPAAASTLRARWVNRENTCCPSGTRPPPSRATNRFWTACLDTPMLAPIWLHDAPIRRA